jgi:hypothetical protein
MSTNVERELFKVYDEREQVPGIGMFASLHSTAYDLQAWEYESGTINVEMFFRAGTPGDDGECLEAQCLIADRGTALSMLREWGAEIKALEDEEALAA